MVVPFFLVLRRAALEEEISAEAKVSTSRVREIERTDSLVVWMARERCGAGWSDWGPESAGFVLEFEEGLKGPVRVDAEVV